MENKLSIEEQFSLKLTNSLKCRTALTEIEEAKISYGISVLLITLNKIIVIYFTSFILGTVFETLLCHIPFCIVRNYSRGFHAKSSFNCGMSGIVCFSILPWLIRSIDLDANVLQVILLGTMSTMILFFRAPADTKKNQIKERKQRSTFKRRAIIAHTILLILIIVVYKGAEQLIGVSGLSIAVVLTLPLEKIFWRN